MRTQLALTITLLLGCIDVDIIGGSDTTAGSTTSVTGDGDGDTSSSGDPASTSESGTEGDGDGDTSDSTDSTESSTETGGTDTGDGDGDPGDGDGDGWFGQMCITVDNDIYLEPDLQCESGSWHLCNVGDFGLDPADLVCCHLGQACYIMATMEVCFDGDEAVCQIEPTMN